jgi:hypothetical protein
MKKNFIIAMFFSFTILSTSCLGSFSAFNGLREWNEGVSGNKFVNNLIFWGLNIIPVYGLFLFADMIIFNVIEFWSGSNPIAMNEGEVETQIVNVNGKEVEMTAMKNYFKIEVLSGEDKGKVVELVYTPEDSTWNAKDGDKLIKLATLEDGFLMVHTPNKTIKLDPNSATEYNQRIINQSVNTYYYNYASLAE